MLNFRNLDDRTRQLMVVEIDSDIADGIYISSYFNERGAELWHSLMREAALSGSDSTLAHAIRSNQCLKSRTTRQSKKGTIFVDVPHNAHETIAESNFSRFYIRALCVRAIEEGHDYIVGYRAKEVMQSRDGSDEKIGRKFSASDVLQDVRSTMSKAPVLGMPPGPNSGILAHLP